MLSIENVTGMRVLALKHKVSPPPSSCDGQPALGSVCSPDGSPHGVAHTPQWGMGSHRYKVYAPQLDSPLGSKRSVTRIPHCGSSACTVGPTCVIPSAYILVVGTIPHFKPTSCPSFAKGNVANPLKTSSLRWCANSVSLVDLLLFICMQIGNRECAYIDRERCKVVRTIHFSSSANVHTCARVEPRQSVFESGYCQCLVL